MRVPRDAGDFRSELNAQPMLQRTIVASGKSAQEVPPPVTGSRIRSSKARNRGSLRHPPQGSMAEKRMRTSRSA